MQAPLLFSKGVLMADFVGASVYKRRSGFHVKCDAQTVGEICAKLEADGNLTAKALVDEGRPEDSPLHGDFEWDDTVAAEKYRETQAGYIIRSVEVVNEGVKEPVKAFFSIVAKAEDEPSQRQYISTIKAVECEDTRVTVLAQALDELNSFRRKYNQLKELAKVFEAIDQLRFDFDV